MLDATAFAMQKASSLARHLPAMVGFALRTPPSAPRCAGKNARGQMAMHPRGAEPAQAGGVYSVGS